MAVIVSGMFGEDNTYFAESPVIIDIDGLEWPTSPIHIVGVDVIYQDRVVGNFHTDTGGSSSVRFDIAPALRAIWSDCTYQHDVDAANSALVSEAVHSIIRPMRQYRIKIYTEYISSDGVTTKTDSGTFNAGRCLLGKWTELEREEIVEREEAGYGQFKDVSSLENTNPRNGDASTKPRTTPELVGRDSITSWADVNAVGTQTYFYHETGNGTGDDNRAHSPIVLRDEVPYVDFLFVNRRGAIETCSARMLESLNINVETKQYSRVGTPSFRPLRSLMAIAAGGRRSWSMSSGYQTREWAEWWTLEFLMARQWWMRYSVGDKEKFLPVTIQPAKKSIVIYDRTKQQMQSVEFTVTLALEG